MPKSESSGIIRVSKNKDNPYVMLHKGFFEDDRLSWKARGILGYLLSKPDNWQVQIRDLMNHSLDGRDSNYAGLKELKNCGYLTKEPVRENGKVVRWISTVYEVPFEIVYGVPGPMPYCTSPLPALPYVEKPDTEKPYHNNNESTKDRDEVFTESITPIPSFIPSGKKERKKENVDESVKRMEEAKAIDAIIEKCEIAYQNLDAVYPGMQESVTETIAKMYTADSVTVKGQTVPQAKVRSILAKLSPEAILHAVEAILEAAKSTIIKNPQQYLMSVICEASTQATLKNAADFTRMEYGSGT